MGFMRKFPDARKRGIRAIAVAVWLSGTLAGGAALSGAPASAATAPRHHAATAVRHHAAPVRHRAIPHPKPARPAPRRVRRGPRPLSPLELSRKGRWRLDIPSIGVATRLLTLGDPDGNRLPTPSLPQASEAAWYDFTAVPGTAGNTVLVGHVDTYLGPAVFYNLYLLRTGDPVYVSVGGKRLRYVVRRVMEVSKAHFPVNQVFGGTTARQLWIITCGGTFDPISRHYRDNIIVSATYRGLFKTDPESVGDSGETGVLNNPRQPGHQ